VAVGCLQHNIAQFHLQPLSQILVVCTTTGNNALAVGQLFPNFLTNSYSGKAGYGGLYVLWFHFGNSVYYRVQPCQVKQFQPRALGWYQL